MTVIGVLFQGYEMTITAENLMSDEWQASFHNTLSQIKAALPVGLNADQWYDKWVMGELPTTEENNTLAILIEGLYTLIENKPR